MFFVYKDYIYGYGAVVLSICAVVMLVIWCKSANKNSCLEMGGYFGVNNQPFMLLLCMRE